MEAKTTRTRAKARRADKHSNLSEQPRRGQPGSVVKISGTVDKGVLRRVLVDAKRAGLSFSAYLTAALDREVRRRALAAVIAEYENEHGPIPQAEVDRARASWQASR